jgi:myosin heavy subunit
MPQTSVREKCQSINALMTLMTKLTEDPRLQIFFRSGTLERLEAQRDEKLTGHIILLQARCRGYLARRKLNTLKVGRSSSRSIELFPSPMEIRPIRKINSKERRESSCAKNRKHFRSFYLINCREIVLNVNKNFQLTRVQTSRIKKSKESSAARLHKRSAFHSIILTRRGARVFALLFILSSSSE